MAILKPCDRKAVDESDPAGLLSAERAPEIRRYNAGMLHSAWAIILATLPVVKAHFIAVFCFTIGEVIFPAERRQPFAHHITNLQYVLLFFFLSPFANILPGAFAAAVARHYGAPLFNMNLPQWGLGVAPVDWALRNLMLPFLPLLVFDFFYYWHHRLQHGYLGFWPIHRLHHSIESLNALGGYRVHWLEEPMRVFTITVPMSLLFNITPVEGAWIGFALNQLGIFIHSNIRIPLGPLTPMITGPQLHRLHHSFKPEHLDKNYAAFFPIWDVLFGTYVPPKPGEWPVTGLAAGERAGNVLQETAYPFLAWGKFAGGRLVRVWQNVV